MGYNQLQTNCSAVYNRTMMEKKLCKTIGDIINHEIIIDCYIKTKYSYVIILYLSNKKYFLMYNPLGEWNWRQIWLFNYQNHYDDGLIVVMGISPATVNQYKW